MPIGRQGVSEPMAPRNRFLRLRAAFTAPDGRFARPNGYGDALWYGIFDAAYTRPGDYLVQARRHLVHRGSAAAAAGAVRADQPYRLVLASGRAREYRRE